MKTEEGVDKVKEHTGAFDHKEKKTDRLQLDSKRSLARSKDATRSDPQELAEQVHTRSCYPTTVKQCE